MSEEQTAVFWPGELVLEVWVRRLFMKQLYVCVCLFLESSMGQVWFGTQ